MTVIRPAEYGEPREAGRIRASRRCAQDSASNNASSTRKLCISTNPIAPDRVPSAQLKRDRSCESGAVLSGVPIPNRIARDSSTTSGAAVQDLHPDPGCPSVPLVRSGTDREWNEKRGSKTLALCLAELNRYERQNVRVTLNLGEVDVQCSLSQLTAASVHYGPLVAP